MHAVQTKLAPLSSFIITTPDRKQRPDALQAVMECIPASVYVVSKEQKVLRFNSRFKQDMVQYLGIEIYEGYDFNELQGVGNADRWKALFTRAFSGIPVHERWEAIVPGNSSVLDISCYPIYCGNTVEEVAVYINNITDQIRLSNDYSTSMERSKLALESTNALAFDWDVKTGVIETTNLEGIVGFHSTLVTPTVEWWGECVVMDADKKKFAAAINLALAQGEKLDVDYRIIDNEGKLKDVHTLATIYRDYDGTALKMVGTTQDITSRKKLERELIKARNTAEEMNRLKTAFLANMSHEIRTPLTAIIGYADLLSEELQETSQGEYSEIISRSGKRLLDTINSLIDLAKIESNAIDLVPESVNINFQIACIVEELRPLASKRTLNLAFETCREQYICFTDRPSLGSILYNLIGNALKFTNEGGVSISLREQRLSSKKAVAIDITDTGIGINNTEKIFQPFLQESNGLNRSHEGSGLGLSITRKLIEALNGTIEVKSCIGKGSTFTVILPLMEVRYSQ